MKLEIGSILQRLGVKADGPKEAEILEQAENDKSLDELLHIKFREEGPIAALEEAAGYLKAHYVEAPKEGIGLVRDKFASYFGFVNQPDFIVHTKFDRDHWQRVHDVTKSLDDYSLSHPERHVQFLPSTVKIEAGGLSEFYNASVIDAARVMDIIHESEKLSGKFTDVQDGVFEDVRPLRWEYGRFDRWENIRL